MRIAMLCLAAAAFAGCSHKPDAPVRTCEVRGEVIRLDPQVRTAVVKHEQICDWMEPMTMEFPIREKRDFDALKTGAKITATVHIGSPEFWLSNIRETK